MTKSIWKMNEKKLCIKSTQAIQDKTIAHLLSSLYDMMGVGGIDYEMSFAEEEKFGRFENNTMKFLHFEAHEITFTIGLRWHFYLMPSVESIYFKTREDLVLARLCIIFPEPSP